MEMAKQWRGGQTCAAKLRGSLACRVPRTWPPKVAAMFLDKAEATVLAAWAAAPPPHPPLTRVSTVCLQYDGWRAGMVTLINLLKG